MMSFSEIESPFDKAVGIEKYKPHKETDQRKTVLITQQRKEKSETFFNAHNNQILSGGKITFFFDLQMIGDKIQGKRIKILCANSFFCNFAAV